MSIPASHRPAREWLLLILALLVVGGVALPLWQLTGGIESQAELLSKWTPQRLSKLFLGPEQVACYVCFLWACLILQSRYREVWRQRQSFHLDLLPTEEGARILPEDARPLARKVEQLTARRPFILASISAEYPSLSLASRSTLRASSMRTIFAFPPLLAYIKVV